MDEKEVNGPILRKRSRSKTPLPEQMVPQKIIASRNTPIHMEAEIIQEETEPEIFTSPPAHRTRNALKTKTPQVNSENVSRLNQLTYLSTEEVQNIKNYSYEYEHISTSQTAVSNSSKKLLGRDEFRVPSSLSGSDYSNESFAESVLADSSKLSVEDGIQHLPYRVYKCAVEYWNKYPKTDYTYSRLSKDRVELAPGQVAVPNMSRPSLHSMRHSSLSSQDLNVASTTSSYFSDSELRQRWLSSTQNTYQNSRGFDGMSDSEVDETDNWRQQSSLSMKKTDNRWKIVKLLTYIWTTIVTTTTTVTSKLFGSDSSAARHRYTNNYYTYSSVNTKKSRYAAFKETMKKKRFWIPLLFLLFLIPALIYWWPLLGLFNKDAEETKIVPIVVSDKFEMTDEMINQIVLRVKQSLPPPPKPEPVVIEKIMETNNVVDKELLSEQQALINKLSADIIFLKNQDHSINQDQLSTLISDHVTRSVIQILGLKSSNKDEIQNDLFDKQREYVDDRVSGVKDAIMWDLRNLDESIREDIKGIKNERALGGGFIQNSEPGDGGCHCDERIKQIVRDALLVYDADKTGLVDYAMESAGGQIISTRCTQSYQTNSAVISLFGIPLWHPSNSPRTVLTPGASPGDCWAFQGFPGYLVIKLFHRIDVTGFTLEHVSHLLSPRGQIESAPKNFTVWGLQDEMDKEPFLFGSYEYRNDSSPEQYFAIQNHDVNRNNELPGHEFVELRIESNHGNPVYTCLYRFRVHGDPIDSAYYQLNGQ